ncbi:hypothetical protein HDV00_008384 [Rhizophlyctis rosea]|nr:hypothetical protein HDV00_008384 [Rhizophlyctis rosea]
MSYIDAFNVLECAQQAMKEDEPTFSALLQLLSSPSLKYTPGAFGNEVYTSLQPYTPSEKHQTLQHLAVTVNQNPAFAEGLTRLLESYFIQSHIKQILSASGHADSVFEGYLKTLQLDNMEAKHEDVMRDIWKWFEAKTDAATVCQLRVAFVEEEAAQLLGMDHILLSNIRALVADGNISPSTHSTHLNKPLTPPHPDPLYTTTLTYLQLHSTSNLHFHQVLTMTSSMLSRHDPSIYPKIEPLLLAWRAELAAQFLKQAREIILDPEVFEEFGRRYLEDEDEAMEDVGDVVEDEELVEQLRALKVGGGGGRR